MKEKKNLDSRPKVFSTPCFLLLPLLLFLLLRLSLIAHTKHDAARRGVPASVSGCGSSTGGVSQQQQQQLVAGNIFVDDERRNHRIGVGVVVGVVSSN